MLKIKKLCLPKINKHFNYLEILLLL